MHRGNRMGRGGAVAWLTGFGGEKEQRVREEKGFHRGSTYSTLLSGSFQTARMRWGNKGFNRCSGCVFGLTVGGQLHCPLISQADSACSSITGASSFKILFSSSRLETRIKESCSMKSILVSNQQCVMKVNWGRGRCKNCLHSQREFDFFEDSQQNSYC